MYKRQSIDEPNAENIAKMIDVIFKKKFAEKQLEESELSFSDLQVVKSCFLDVLMGVYHNRIKYPEPKEAKEDD